MSVFSEILGKLPQSLTEQSASSSVVAASRDQHRYPPWLQAPHQPRAQGPGRTRLNRQRGGGGQKLGMSLSPRRGIFAPLQYNLGQIT